MDALQKGKARARVDRADPAGPRKQPAIRHRRHSQSRKTDTLDGNDEASSHGSYLLESDTHAGPSSAARRRRGFPPPLSSNSEDDGAEDEEAESDLEQQHESEDEFEQHRSGAAPSYAQYVGDSEMEDDSAESDSQDGAGSQPDDDRSGLQSGTDEEQGLLTGVQADLQQIPLETLIKAQKKLNRLSKGSSNKKTSPGNEDQPDTNVKASTSRRGRTESRRGVIPDLPKVSQKTAQGKLARPKARDSKHAPTEVTSKRAVPRFRQVVEVTKDTRRDPRFDALSGELDDNRFRTSYSFIDEARKEEIKSIKFALSAARKRKGAVDMEELEAMSAQLQKLQSKQAEAERQRRQDTVMSEWKHKEKEKRQSGKSEFYLKRGEKKKMVESKRMEEVSQDKRRLRKVLKRKDQAEKKKSIQTAPPRRQT